MTTPIVAPVKAPNFIQRAFLNLWVEITGLSKAFWADFEPVLVSDAGKALQALLPLALPIVLGLATSGKTGSEKQSEAVTALEAAAAQAGVATAADLLNTTVEFALQNLKATGQISAPVVNIPAPQEENGTPVS